MNSKHFLFRFTAAFIALATLIYVIFQYAAAKQGFHIDEIYSYGLSNSYYRPFPTASNDWISGNYYQNYLMPNDVTAFQYGSVMSNQVNDVHPPLYYMLFHTIASFWQDGFSPMVGLTLNIGVHIITAIVIALILFRLTKNVYVSIAAGLFWGVSIGGLSSMLFIRMYHLMGLFIVLLLYWLLLYIRSDRSWPYLLLIPIFITTLCGALTHYYFYLFAFFIIAVTCLGLLVSKHIKKAISVGITAIIAVGGAWWFFPAIIRHIFESNRGVEVLNNANNESMTDNLRLYLSFVQEDLLADVPLKIFSISLLVLTLLLLSQSKQLINRNTFLEIIIVVIPAALYVFLVQDLSHYHTSRYIYPIYPVIAIAVVLIVYYALRVIKNKKAQTLSSIIILLAISVTGFQRETVDFQYLDQGELNEQIATHPTNSAMIFSGTRWKIAEYSPQLAQYDLVYPMVLESTEENALPTLQEGQLGEALTVFTNNQALDQKDLIHSIQSKYQLDHYEVLFKSHDLLVYHFRQ